MLSENRSHKKNYPDLNYSKVGRQKVLTERIESKKPQAEFFRTLSSSLICRGRSGLISRDVDGFNSLGEFCVLCPRKVFPPTYSTTSLKSRKLLSTCAIKNFSLSQVFVLIFSQIRESFSLLLATALETRFSWLRAFFRFQIRIWTF